MNLRGKVFKLLKIKDDTAILAGDMAAAGYPDVAERLLQIADQLFDAMKLIEGLRPASRAKKSSVFQGKLDID